MISKVSVIIPVYNDQTGIDACLMALAVQTYPADRYEVIVVDNASNPPIQLDPAFSSFASLVVCPTPGSYAARNAGIAAARGEVLAFTDADCLPDRGWISAGVAALVREEERCIIGGEVVLSLSEKPTAIECYQYLVGFMQRENIEDRGFSVTANLFATKAQVVAIGLFNEKLLSGGDLEWCWRAAKAGFLVQYAPDVIVHTAPRTSLVSAIRQARRVAGGRYALRCMELEHIPSLGLKPHRSMVSAAKWILSHPKLTIWNCAKVLAVASLLKIVQVLETLRLSYGVRPERR